MKIVPVPADGDKVVMKIGDTVTTRDAFCEHKNMRCTVVEIIEKDSYTMYKVEVNRTGIILVGFDWEFEEKT